MTRVAKTFGGILVTLLVCLLLALTANPNYARAAYRWIHRHPPFRETSFPSDQRFNALPKVVLWTWERPEDLQFLSPKAAGVAFLAKTIYLPVPARSSQGETAGKILVRPRLQPLRVIPETSLIAVVRIETARGDSAYAPETSTDYKPASGTLYSASEVEHVASEIADLQDLHGVRGIQIDFDATLSQRSFYSAILSEVRRRLAPSMPLSITALASWCMGDPWLEQLPPGTIQEAVPMLFRIGPDARHVANFLRSGSNFPVAVCQGSLGLSTDETLSQHLLAKTLPGLPPSSFEKRIYVFAPVSWTPSSADTLLKEWLQ